MASTEDELQRRGLGVAGLREHERRLLEAVLMCHQRVDERWCACGWGELGASHAEHVVGCFQMALGSDV